MEAKTCAQCLKPAAGKGVSLSSCSGCHRVAYCGKSCQKLHWGLGHREQCIQTKKVTKETLKKATGDEASAPTSPSTAEIPEKMKKGGGVFIKRQGVRQLLGVSIKGRYSPPDLHSLQIRLVLQQGMPKAALGKGRT